MCQGHWEGWGGVGVRERGRDARKGRDRKWRGTKEEMKGGRNRTKKVRERRRKEIKEDGNRIKEGC